MRIPSTEHTVTHIEGNQKKAINAARRAPCSLPALSMGTQVTQAAPTVHFVKVDRQREQQVHQHIQKSLPCVYPHLSFSAVSSREDQTTKRHSPLSVWANLCQPTHRKRRAICNQPNLQLSSGLYTCLQKVTIEGTGQRRSHSPTSCLWKELMKSLVMSPGTVTLSPALQAPPIHSALAHPLLI